MKFENKEKKYNTLNEYYRNKFGGKVFKVSLNANFTCPHLKNGHGCTFCLEGSGEYAGEPTKSLIDQFVEVKTRMHLKWPDAKYIVYFQANTNTLGELNKLRGLYEEALTLDENIVGLSISTRPDCISDELVNYFAELSKKTYLTIELGLQSIWDESLDFINRGHNYKTFKDMALKLRENGINVIVHIINGLPTENKDMMIETIKEINTLDIQGVKIHLLHVMEGTLMGEDFKKNPFKILSLEEYVDITVTQIENLDPKIIVHRVTGDAPSHALIAPTWSLKKFVVMNEIDKEFRKRGTYQGCYV